MKLTRKSAALSIAAAIALLSVVALVDDLTGDDGYDFLAEPAAFVVATFVLTSLVRVADLRRHVGGPQWVLTLSDPRSPPRV